MQYITDIDYNLAKSVWKLKQKIDKYHYLYVLGI